MYIDSDDLTKEQNGGEMMKLRIFSKKVKWLGFKISGDGAQAWVSKAHAFEKHSIHKHVGITIVLRFKKPGCKICTERFCFELPHRSFLNKKSVYKWNTSQSIAFEKLKSEKVNIIENSHYLKEKTRRKPTLLIVVLARPWNNFKGDSGKRSFLPQNF